MYRAYNAYDWLKWIPTFVGMTCNLVCGDDNVRKSESNPLIPILSNFYVILAIIFSLVIIVSAPNYSPKAKVIILLIGLAVMLWLDRPDWLMRLLWKAGWIH